MNSNLSLLFVDDTSLDSYSLYSLKLEFDLPLWRLIHMVLERLNLYIDVYDPHMNLSVLGLWNNFWAHALQDRDSGRIFLFLWVKSTFIGPYSPQRPPSTLKTSLNLSQFVPLAKMPMWRQSCCSIGMIMVIVIYGILNTFHSDFSWRVKVGRASPGSLTSTS